jgi:hypothetical protein
MLKPTPVPRLFALMAKSGDRMLRGEGALLQNPAPAAAALLLRAGAPSVSLTHGAGELTLEAVDFDSGGLAIAGHGRPHAGLRLSLEGQPAAAGQVEESGAFDLLAVQGDLKPGLHRLRLADDAGAEVSVQIDATPSTPADDAPYAVRPVAGGWRVDWSTPGGGSQSSVIFAPPITAVKP